MRLRATFSAAFFGIAVATASASPAFAQAKPKPAAPPPAAQPADLQNARLHFAAGVNLLRDPAKPRYEEAYREFKVAYSLSPAPQILGNLALTAMMLERDSEAISAYEDYIKGMIEIPAQEREQIDRDLQTLKLGVARVTFTSNVPETSIVDKRIPAQGESINNVYGPLTAMMPFPVGIRQGHHVITARAPGKQDIVWEVDATAGDLGLHPFEFPDDKPVAPVGPVGPVSTAPPPAPDRPIPKTFWYGAAATAGLGVATVVTGIVALNTASSFERANDGTNPERADELQSRTQALNVTTDILLVGTIVAAAFTGYIYFTRPEKERTSAFTSFARGTW